MCAVPKQQQGTDTGKADDRQERSQQSGRARPWSDDLRTH